MQKRGVETTYLELQVLKSANHPFLTRMRYFYYTADRFYFVMPFVGGGELSLVLKHSPNGCFEEKQIKFYMI